MQINLNFKIMPFPKEITVIIKKNKNKIYLQP